MNRLYVIYITFFHCLNFIRSASMKRRRVNGIVTVLLVSYDTHDEFIMEVASLIFNSTIKSSGTTRSAVVYNILADVLVTSLTCTSLSQEATREIYKHN